MKNYNYKTCDEVEPLEREIDSLNKQIYKKGEKLELLKVGGKAARLLEEEIEATKNACDKLRHEVDNWYMNHLYMKDLAQFLITRKVDHAFLGMHKLKLGLGF